MADKDSQVARTTGIEAYEAPAVRKNRGMVTLTITLAANSPQQVGIDGDYFHVLRAPVNDLKVRFDEDRQTSAYEGVGFRRYYSRMELSSATGQAIEIMVGFGSVADARSTANVSVTANVAPGNTINDGGAVSCVHAAATQLLTADTTRLYAIIKNPSTNTLTMYIGTSAVNATKGVPVEPGETFPYAVTAAIYAYNADVALDETLYAASVQEV